MKKHTVLVIDDEPSIIEVWTRILSDEGYRVVRATDAFSALGLLATNWPAVAICDINLPERDGVWLANMIHRKCPRTAIVLASGESEMRPHDTLRDVVVAYMQKPISREQLLAAVRIGIRWVRNRTSVTH